MAEVEKSARRHQWRAHAKSPNRHHRSEHTSWTRIGGADRGRRSKTQVGEVRWREVSNGRGDLVHARGRGFGAAADGAAARGLRCEYGGWATEAEAKNSDEELSKGGVPARTLRMRVTLVTTRRLRLAASACGLPLGSRSSRVTRASHLPH